MEFGWSLLLLRKHFSNSCRSIYLNDEEFDRIGVYKELCLGKRLLELIHSLCGGGIPGQRLGHFLEVIGERTGFMY